MDIICSAGKGQLSKEECLACSRELPPCGYDYALMRPLLEAQEARPDVHVTDLTGCIKQAAWKKVVPMPERPHETLVRAAGVWIHSCLEQNEHDDFIRTEIPVEGLGIVGRADVIYANGRLVDFKTTRWIRQDKLPYSSHGMQTNIYAQLLREMGYEVTEIFIQYIDVSGPTKCRKHQRPYQKIDGVWQCPVCGGTSNNAHGGAVMIEIPLIPEEEIKEFITTRRDIIQDVQDQWEVFGEGTLPMGEPSFLCNYCAYQDQCEEAELYNE